MSVGQRTAGYRINDSGDFAPHSDRDDLIHCVGSDTHWYSSLSYYTFSNLLKTIVRNQQCLIKVSIRVVLASLARNISVVVKQVYCTLSWSSCRCMYLAKQSLLRLNHWLHAIRRPGVNCFARSGINSLPCVGNSPVSFVKYGGEKQSSVVIYI